MERDGAKTVIDEILNPTTEEPSGRDALLVEVRKFVLAQMKEGVQAPDLTFVLAYVAAELGFSIASVPLRVIPVVLEAVSQASIAHSSATQDQAEESRSAEEIIPDACTIH